MSSQAIVYSQNSSLQIEDGLEHISHLDLQDGMNVLDLGCGTGYLASVLAERVGKTGQVVGIDPDKERIAVAESTYRSIGNLTFKESSAETMEYPEKSFDVAFSNHVIHWIEDKRKVFNNIFCCLKSSGLFACVFVSEVAPDLQNLINLMEQSRVSVLMDSKFHFISVSSMADIAASCGFILQYVDTVNRKFIFNNFDEFVQFAYGSTGGIIDTKFMDAQKLQKFKEEVNVQDGVSISSTHFCIFKKN